MAIIAIFFVSCTHQYYVPINHNVPMLDKKGDLNASLHLGNASDVETAFEGQAAYAVTNNVGVTLSGFHARGGEFGVHSDTTGFQSRSDNGKGSGVEIGAGYFHPFLKRGFNTLQGEIYGGFGYSSQLHNYTSDQAMYKYNIRYNAMKFFVQPSFGYKMPYFEAILNIRFTVFNRSDLQIMGTPTAVDNEEIRKLDPATSLFFEPSLTLRGGLPNLKLQLQLIGNEAISQTTIPYDNIYMGVGLMYMLR